MKLNTLFYAFVSFIFLSVSCSENPDKKRMESSVSEVLVADPLHGLRAVNLNENELDIQIYIPEKYYDDEDGYPRFIQPIITHNLGEARWEVTLPGKSRWHLVIEENVDDSSTILDELNRLKSFDFFSYNIVEQTDSSLVYTKSLNVENTTLDSLEMVKNAYYHFLCKRKINGFNLTFKSDDMKDFRKPTVDQMLTSAKFAF
tara:strand:- start:131 stop:736 length:606 start_codon:yes stop_codon:yes gene_type:complete